MIDPADTIPDSHEASKRRRPAFSLAWRAAWVRLRFVSVLLVAFVVVGKWDAIRNRAETLVRRVAGARLLGRQQAVSADTEYFCPMDPGVLSDWPGKCGICNMGLVRRKKGETSPLPDGVLARMQISPYRIQLAGIQTAPAEYRALEHEVTGVGRVVAAEGSATVIEASFFERDLRFVSEGTAISISSDVSPPGKPGLEGSIIRMGPGASATIRVEERDKLLPLGVTVSVTYRVPVARTEPFASMPADPPPIAKGEPRTLHVCAEHASVLKESPGRCPKDRNSLVPIRLADNQRVGWWCPMHPEVVAAAPGASCAKCEGMKLVPRMLTFNPPGQVLAVPEPAVIDTGTRTVVFVERMPGMFDALEVVVGPRCAGYYAVVSGLAPGDRVAAAGAFLIDAETRLNPSLAAGYFGAGRDR